MIEVSHYCVGTGSPSLNLNLELQSTYEMCYVNAINLDLDLGQNRGFSGASVLLRVRLHEHQVPSLD